jgi:glycosyltransferase involved in cell wall biosynthesis
MKEEKIRIALTMIVKNEAHCIERCLESVFKSGLIDYFRIVDTGSTDNTIALITKAFAQYGVDGEVVELPFTNYADCRNFALNGLEELCDYAFWIDADEQFEFSAGQDADSIKDNLKGKDAGYVKAIDGVTAFFRSSFFKLSPDIKWKGRVHEYVAGLAEENSVIIDACHINVYQEGSSWKGNARAKQKRYLELLFEQHKEEPKEPRWVYFIADTYRNIREPQFDKLAMDWYGKRIAMDGGSIEENYISRVMLASMQIRETGSANESLLEGCGKIFDRGEHLLTLANYYQSKGMIDKSYRYSADMVKYFWNIPEGASMMIDREVYFVVMPLTHAYNCYLLGKKQDAQSAIDYCVRALNNGISTKPSNAVAIKKLSVGINEMK